MEDEFAEPLRRVSERIHHEPRRPPKWRRPRYRCFEEIPCYPVGYQSGRFDRYPPETRTASLPLPQLSIWRINLAALSQRYNLYFVASVDRILVFQPEHDQHVRSRPDLTIPIPSPKSSRQGHILPQFPRALNNMIVDCLGEEEILLCACDNGDVVGMYTKQIYHSVKQEIERRLWTTRDPGPNQPSSNAASSANDGRHPSIFFHKCVGHSAWGLAVHRQAGLIAASCNLRNITIWAPALTCNREPDGKAQEVDELIRKSRKDRTQAYSIQFPVPNYRGLHTETYDIKCALSCHRLKDQVSTLRGHQENIPSIAFCTHSTDAQGTFLASTSIDGAVIIWNADRGYPIRSIVPLRLVNSSIEDRWNHPERAGWGVMFLNPASFKPVSCKEDWLFTEGQFTWTPNKSSHEMYNITNTRRSVRSTGFWTPASAIVQTSDKHADLHDFIAHDDATSDSGDEIDEADLVAEMNSLDPLRTLLWHSYTAKFGHSFPPETCTTGLIPSADEMPDAPVLLLTKHSVQLFQSSALLEKAREGVNTGPVTVLLSPLDQSMPQRQRTDMAVHDRLNLFVQIPALGIVLVGSPIGRVAVITLHRVLPEDGLETMPDALPGSKSPRSFYTMRLDHLLPTKQQEQKGCRPWRQLVGLSAGPVIGYEGKVSKNRYRVTMLYGDSTVMVYELARERDRTVIV